VVLKQTKSTDPSWSEGVEHGLEKREKEEEVEGRST
jgi:hypothetical protein